MKQQCACGCGTAITKGAWVPGHDHRAIHERISRDHGSVAAFIEWYDRTAEKQANKRAAAVTAAATRASNRRARSQV